jgi:hypothetical protein
MFLLILAISIITAIAQIISTSYDLKNPIKSGVSKITIAGWVFYICTGILAFIPAIQKAAQENIDVVNENARIDEQEKRDGKLKREYDSSLVEMEKKFDNTTNIVSETLGKYGYKLDSTNLILVKMNDSSKTKVYVQGDPVLRLASVDDGENGITLVRKDNDIYTFKIGMVSDDAGSGYFDISLQFIVDDSIKYNINSEWSQKFLSLNDRIPKGAYYSAHQDIQFDGKLYALFLLVTGSYKRLDGTGYFPVDDLYALYLTTNAVRKVKGQTRERVLTIAKQLSDK